MAGLQHESLLLNLVYELRLAIYAHIILPPFNEHHEFAGLFLSCRQIKKEMEREGQIRLRLHFAKLERDVAEIYKWNRGEGSLPPRIYFSSTLNAYGVSEIIVTLPFVVAMLDENEDAHHHTLARSDNGLDWLGYAFDFSFLLSMLNTHGALFTLHASIITFNLEPGTITVDRIHPDEWLIDGDIHESDSEREGLVFNSVPRYCRTAFAHLFLNYWQEIQRSAARRQKESVSDSTPINVANIALQWKDACPRKDHDSRLAGSLLQSTQSCRLQSSLIPIHFATDILLKDYLNGSIVAKLNIKDFIQVKERDGETWSPLQGKGFMRDYALKMEQEWEQIQEKALSVDPDQENGGNGHG